jgi:osmotically-inducible protein OsmY
MKTDSQLYNDVLNKLEFEPDIDDKKLAISIHEGIVTLGGVVNKYNEKVAAERAVKSVFGVKGVANEIAIESVPQYQRDDVSIAKSAVKALEFDSVIPTEAIKVVVERGWVVLSGEVPWNFQRRAAESCINNLYGIKGIINQIEVKAGVTPGEVKNCIIKEFERNALIDAEGIRVEAEGSTVTLSGRVRNWSEMEAAENAAWAVPGVSHVNNLLTI